MTRSAKKVQGSFWIIGTVALLWNLAGVANYLAQMDPAVFAGYSWAERVIIGSRPAWATAAFAIAVFAGALGSLLLLMRQSISVYAFDASLVAVIATHVHALGARVSASEGLQLTIAPPGEVAATIVIPLVAALFLAWYAHRAAARGWTR